MALINVPKKIEKAREALGLTADERIIAACTTNPKGTMTRMLAGQLGGVGGVLANEKMRTPGRVDEVGLAERFVAGQNFVVVTSRRLLLVKMGAMTGKAKELLAEWRIDEVADIVVEEGRTAYPMTIVFADGTGVQIEGAKGSDPKSVGAAVSPR